MLHLLPISIQFPIDPTIPLFLNQQSDYFSIVEAEEGLVVACRMWENGLHSWLLHYVHITGHRCGSGHAIETVLVCWFQITTYKLVHFILIQIPVTLLNMTNT